MPVEVWQKNFLLTFAGSDRFDITQTDDGPWVLCRVRRQWETTASSLPDLWSKFTLLADTTTVTVKESRRTCFLLNAAIPRSASRPLDFSVLITDDDAAEVVLPPLIEVMDRWRDVSIEAPPRALQFFATYVKLTLRLSGNALAAMRRLRMIEFRAFTTPLQSGDGIH